MPSFDLFFLSSLFFGLFINIFTFPISVIIILVVNSLTIYFGLSYFEFRSGDSLNEKYTFKENIYLIGLYLLIYLFLGIIALIPNDILQKGFILYEIQKRDKNYPTIGMDLFSYICFLW